MSFDLELINSDLSIKPDGTIRTVDKTDKLRQDIIKIILTPIGSVKFHPWYGSSVNDGLIGETVPDNMLFQDINTSILQSLSKLQTLQRSQATSQRVSLAEMIASVRDILVQRNPSDPRQVNAIILVIAKDFNTVEESFGIST